MYSIYVILYAEKKMGIFFDCCMVRYFVAQQVKYLLEDLRKKIRFFALAILFRCKSLDLIIVCKLCLSMFLSAKNVHFEMITCNLLSTRKL